MNVGEILKPPSLKEILTHRFRIPTLQFSTSPQFNFHVRTRGILIHVPSPYDKIKFRKPERFMPKHPVTKSLQHLMFDRNGVSIQFDIACQARQVIGIYEIRFQHVQEGWQCVTLWKELVFNVDAPKSCFLDWSV